MSVHGKFALITLFRMVILTVGKVILVAYWEKSVKLTVCPGTGAGAGAG